MRCENCPLFAREDYAWGGCRLDNRDREASQSCDADLVEYKERRDEKHHDTGEEGVPVALPLM